MARTPAQRQVYADLLDRYGRLVADAFFRAIDNIRSAAEIGRLTAAIEAGQIEEALEALHIDPEAFNDVLDRIRDAQAEGGKAAADGMPKRNPDGTALVVRFDGRNPEAEAWLSRYSSSLITRLTEEQRTIARETITDGMRRGQNPKQTALDLVGRISRVTGKRVGGVIGLSKTQVEFVQSSRAELASGDPAAMQNYLTRTRRNRQFDRSVAKAIREGKPVDPAIAAKAVTAYETQLLRLRGETIAKHETFAALETAKEQAYRQAVSSGKVSESAVIKTWRHFSSRNPRDQHRAINGQKVGLNGVFVMPDGTVMRYPHDPAAPIRHTAGCLCQTDYSIDFYAGLR